MRGETLLGMHGEGYMLAPDRKLDSNLAWKPLRAHQAMLGHLDSVSEQHQLGSELRVEEGGIAGCHREDRGTQGGVSESSCPARNPQSRDYSSL